MPQQETMEQVLALVESLEEPDKKYLKEYLAEAPLWLMQSFRIRQLEKGTIFIHEEEEVDTIYLLVKGTVRAVDHRVLGIAYDYMRFEPIKVFGTMEILLDREIYETTLSAVTDCTILEISRHKFEKWVRSDRNALLMEIKSMGNYLLEQAGGVGTLHITRQELSESSGLCVKTVNRSVKTMEEEGYLSKKGYTLEINKSQYMKMKAFLADKVANYEKNKK